MLRGQWEESLYTLPTLIVLEMIGWVNGGINIMRININNLSESCNLTLTLVPMHGIMDDVVLALSSREC